MIVALTGVIGSGKTFCRDALVAQGYMSVDFKDELLDMCSDLVGYDIRRDYDGFKEYLVGFQPQHLNTEKMHLQWTKEQHREYSNRCVAMAPLAMTGRRLLQRMGTEVMRKRDPNYWANAWAKKVKKAAVSGQKDFVCADCRFENELQVITDTARQLGTDYKIIFCDYRSPRYNATSEHESERLAQHYLAMGYKDGEEIRI